MSLQTDIKAQLKEAMIAKDSVKLTVIRGLMTAFTNELVATNRTPQSELTDDEVLALIRRAVKQRKDSIEQFTQGGRAELAESEQAELAILETYLPVVMTADEIRPFAIAKKAEMNIQDASKSGILVGALNKELQGKALGADIKAVVDSLFA